MKIFKRITEKIEELSEKIDKIEQNIKSLYTVDDLWHKNTTKSLNEYKTIIQNQDAIIKSLFEFQANNSAMECMTFVPYRGKPVVIKNGKILSNDNMTSFSVDWSFDNKTDVTIREE